MSYTSRLYRQRNPHVHDGEQQKPFFSHQNDINKPQNGNAFFQAKLSVNKLGDSYEKEADSAANAVVNKSPGAPVVQQMKISSIQRLATAPEEEKVSTNDMRMERDKEKPYQLQKKSNEPGEDKMKEEDKMKKSIPVQAKQDGNDAAPQQVSSKVESSAGRGNKLPSKTLHEMNSSFGVDFNSVRIHNDSESAVLNKELRAHAFTHGNDIYFNSGKYNPDTQEGKFLLAHELVHTIQQRNEETKENKIQRSFWGTVGGAVGGAIGGFFLGGLFGAIAGGIAGATSGDALTTDRRYLNKEELTEAYKVFGNSLDYEKILVSDSSTLMTLGGPARTPWNTIYFPSGTLNSKDYYPWMIHELTHVWQTQHGVSVFRKIWTAIHGQSAYDFKHTEGLWDAASEGKCFNDFNTEQQGDILEGYYVKLNEQSDDLFIYEYFASQVKNTNGDCPGDPPTAADILEPKYRQGPDSDLQTA